MIGKFPAKFPWAPRVGLALLLALGIYQFPQVTLWLRPSFYGLWTFLAGPIQPPPRIEWLTLEAPATGQVHPRLHAILGKLFRYRASLVAVEGNLVGWDGKPETPLPALSQWLPSTGSISPLVVGYPWDAQPLRGAPRNRLQGRSAAQGPALFQDAPVLRLPAERGISEAIPREWDGLISLGFLQPASPDILISADLLRKTPDGLTLSFGAEALRRAFSIPEGALPYYAGMGFLLGKNLILPANSQGQAPLRRYPESGFTGRPAEYLLSGDLSAEDISGKLVFLADARATLRSYEGPLSRGELAAVQAANLLARQGPLTPQGAAYLALFAGLVLAGAAMAALIWFGPLLGLVIALGLALLYPVLSFVFFLASHWWLPPESPLFMVAVAVLPFVWRPARPSQPVPRREKKTAPPRPETKLPPPAPEKALETPPPAKPIAPRVSVPAVASEVERDGTGNILRIGKYKVVRKMGRGSAGEVLEAVDLQMGRKVAVKTMLAAADLHFDRAFERFLVEARAAGSLNHPHINTIYDFGTIDKISFMVLEYLDGSTLSQWMKAHPRPGYPAIAPWLGQIASALDYAHAHKVIHRDLKPSNLMVIGGDQDIKLLDFGVAKFGDVMLTQTGMTVGTPTYMSPEQLQGLKVGPASDQYALAVLTYQLLTYKLPYLGQKIPEICNKILKGELTSILEYKPDLPPSFWAAMLRAFDRQPENRYPTCMGFFQALDASFAGRSPGKTSQSE